MASIAAAAIAAGGAAYQMTQSAQGAQAAAKAASKTKTIPLPGYANVADRYAAQLAVLNANVQPPSFQDWVKSGGQATFPMRDPGLTPEMERNLGLVNKAGYNVPRITTDTAGLTPDQLMYLGMQDFWSKGGPAKPGGKKNPMGYLASVFRNYYNAQRQSQRASLGLNPKPNTQPAKKKKGQE